MINPTSRKSFKIKSRIIPENFRYAGISTPEKEYNKIHKPLNYRSFKGVIFDFDGVMIDSEPLQFKTWNVLFKQHGINIDLATWTKNHGGWIAKDILNYYLEHKYPPNIINQLVKEKQRLTYEAIQKNFQPVKGIADFVRFLKKKKIKIAIATSSFPKKVEYGLMRLDIKDEIDIIITHKDVKKPKPDPEIFNIAIQKLKLLPKDCIIFEDSHSGVEAAKKSGAKVVLVMTSHSSSEFPKDYLYDFIKDFTGVGEKLFK